MVRCVWCNGPRFSSGALTGAPGIIAATAAGADMSILTAASVLRQGPRGHWSWMQSWWQWTGLMATAYGPSRSCPRVRGGPSLPMRCDSPIACQSAGLLKQVSIQRWVGGLVEDLLSCLLERFATSWDIVFSSAILSGESCTTTAASCLSSLAPRSVV